MKLFMKKCKSLIICLLQNNYYVHKRIRNGEFGIKSMSEYTVVYGGTYLCVPPPIIRFPMQKMVTSQLSIFFKK